MKILSKSRLTDKWWVGKEVKCKCGFTGVIESGDDVDNGQFMKIGCKIRFECECGRETYIKSQD